MARHAACARLKEEGREGGREGGREEKVVSPELPARWRGGKEGEREGGREEGREGDGFHIPPQLKPI